jgi:hypothetical protein
MAKAIVLDRGIVALELAVSRGASHTMALCR